MRYLFLIALLTSCSPYDPSGVIRYVDVTMLPECDATTLKSCRDFVTFTADNGDVLYVADRGGAVCLKRHKVRKGPQKRPHEKK